VVEDDCLPVDWFSDENDIDVSNDREEIDEGFYDKDDEKVDCLNNCSFGCSSDCSTGWPSNCLTGCFSS
jgi:hypothetical protein